MSGPVLISGVLPSAAILLIVWVPSGVVAKTAIADQLFWATSFMEMRGSNNPLIVPVLEGRFEEAERSTTGRVNPEAAMVAFAEDVDEAKRREKVMPALQSIFQVQSAERLLDLLNGAPMLRTQFARDIEEEYVQARTHPEQDEPIFSARRALLKCIGGASDNYQCVLAYFQSIESFGAELGRRLQALIADLEQSALASASDDPSVYREYAMKCREALRLADSMGANGHVIFCLLALGATLRDRSESTERLEAFGALKRAAGLLQQDSTQLEAAANSLAEAAIALYGVSSVDRLEVLRAVQRLYLEALALTHNSELQGVILNNLALATCDLNATDADGLRSVLELCDRAQALRPRETQPLNWAHTEVQRGLALSRIAAISPSPDIATLERAEASFRQAREESLRGGEALLTAKSVFYLASVILDRVIGKELLRAADKLAQEATASGLPVSERDAVAAVKTIRGWSLNPEIRVSDAEAAPPPDIVKQVFNDEDRQLLVKALQFTDDAISASPGEDDTWAQSKGLRGSLLRALYGDGEGSRQAWRSALTVLTPSNQPAECRTYGLLLGNSLAYAGEWDEAGDVFLNVLAAQRVLHETAATESRRQLALDHDPIAVRSASYCLANSGRHRLAVEILETDRGQLLNFVSSPSRIELEALAVVDQRLAAEILAARRELLEGMFSDPELNASSLWETWHTLLPLARQLPGFEGFGKPDAAGAAWKLRDDGVQCLYVVPTFWGTKILSIRSPNSPDDQSIRVADIPLTSGQIVAALMQPVMPELGLLTAQSPGPRTTAGEMVSQLSAAIRGVLPRIEPLADSILGLVERELVPLVVTTGLTGLLPLAATALGDGNETNPSSALACAPAAALLLSSTPARAPRRADKAKLLLLGHPRRPDLADLQWTPTEISAVEALFGGTARKATDSKATKAFLLENAPDAEFIHLACHATSGLQASVGNVVCLTDGDLPLSELVRGVSLSARLVVLSACQTAHIDFSRSPEESLGLASGFLAAGASAVVASLWPVSDKATAALMKRFYGELLKLSQDGVYPVGSPARALAASQNWLRRASMAQVDSFLFATGATENRRARIFKRVLPRFIRTATNRGQVDVTTPYGDPYYWAGFVAVGA